MKEIVIKSIIDSLHKYFRVVGEIQCQIKGDEIFVKSLIQNPAPNDLINNINHSPIILLQIEVDIIPRDQKRHYYYDGSITFSAIKYDKSENKIIYFNDNAYQRKNLLFPELDQNTIKEQVEHSIKNYCWHIKFYDNFFLYSDLHTDYKMSLKTHYPQISRLQLKDNKILIAFQKAVWFYKTLVEEISSVIDDKANQNIFDNLDIKSLLNHKKTIKLKNDYELEFEFNIKERNITYFNSVIMEIILVTPYKIITRDKNIKMRSTICKINFTQLVLNIIEPHYHIIQKIKNYIIYHVEKKLPPIKE